jgi:hypothetical protein
VPKQPQVEAARPALAFIASLAAEALAGVVNVVASSGTSVLADHLF